MVIVWISWVLHAHLIFIVAAPIRLLVWLGFYLHGKIRAALDHPDFILIETVL